MRKYRITIKDQSYDVEIEDVHTSPVRVTVDGMPFEVQLEEQPPLAAINQMEKSEPSEPNTVAPMALAAAPAGPGQGKLVSAPMPGTIMDLQVVVGQGVQRGQPLCHLEAMKMKNVIRSPRAGVVAQVLVGEGQTVAYGETLVVFV